MIVLRIIGILLLAVLVLGILLMTLAMLLPARIEIKRVLPDGAVKLRVGYGPIRKVFVLGKKQQRKKPKEKTTPPKEKKEQPLEKKPAPKPDINALLEQAIPLAFELTDDLAGAMTWERLHVTVLFHKDDPAETAWQLGRWCAIVGNLYPQMERAFVLKDTKIVLDADFEAEHLVWGVDISIMTRCVRFIRIGWRRRKRLFAMIKLFLSRKSNEQDNDSGKDR